MEYITSVNKLRLKFPDEKGLLFKDLTLSFKKGEKVLLLGPSGCGKSTLIQVLSGLIPYSIDIPIKSENIQIPNSWGFVFQDPDSQFCMPFVDEEIAFVLENLQVPREEMPERINELLDMVGLQLEDIHTSIQALSGGMKQRLAIASVLALNPDVIFLDEPTALIDEEGTEQIWNTVKNISRDKTIIIVEHKIEQIIDFVDRVIIFTPDGELLADGNMTYIFSNYKEELKKYGIWYPGAWEDFKRENNQKPVSLRNDNEVHLKNFHGYRKKEVKISLEEALIHSGEWIAVNGQNGAGKSTLLLSLMQLIKTSGDYQINEQSIKKLADLQRKAYLVFQNPEYQFITNSVFEEISYELKGGKEINNEYFHKKANDLLTIFGLHDKQHQHPYHLSLGEKRRLSVATAFIQNPKLLLLDEPTFGQDAQNTFKLLELIEAERQKGTIIIMVTHDLNIVQHFATRIWEVKEGRVISDRKKNETKKEAEEKAYEYSI
jgi:energy-coupling factor transport system ATP-binding protein